MSFIQINPLLQERGLNSPNLEVLVQDANLYTSLLFQPSGSLEYSDTFLRFSNPNIAEQKFNTFFNKAIEENANIAITPEYSCPWSVIQNLIVNNRFPNENNLWVVGAESIQANALQQIINDTQDRIVWILDNEVVQQNVGRNFFFDPLCYFFKTRRSDNNQEQIVVVVQFKTHPMGGNEWERDNFIRGNRIYVLENATESIRLITLICSDALTININDLPNIVNYPYLIVHLQLNQVPSHQNFRKYRCDLYSMGREKKEFICLNWGRNVQLGQIANWNSFGGTAIYTKSNKLDLTDDRLNANHSHGLYYTHWKNKYASVYYFNYDEYLFLLRNTKPSQEQAPPPNRNRTGPEMITTYEWNSQEETWSDKEDVDDQFGEYCNSIGVPDYGVLLSEELNPINKERLLTLSVGQAISADWFKVDSIPFFKIDDAEIVNRITFTQHPNDESHANRRRYLYQYSILCNTIITDEGNFPNSIVDLAGNCMINYRSDGFEREYNLNLYPTNGDGIPATGIYLGETDPTTANTALNSAQMLFTDSQQSLRLVVWYRDLHGETQNLFIDSKPAITDNRSKSPISIVKTKK